MFKTVEREELERYICLICLEVPKINFEYGHGVCYHANSLHLIVVFVYNGFILYQYIRKSILEHLPAHIQKFYKPWRNNPDVWCEFI